MKRDAKGKFIPDPPVLTDVFSQPSAQPTSEDMDRHQEAVKAENQARMDTEKKQAVYEGMTLDEEDREWIRNCVREKVEDRLEPTAPPYFGVALFAASLAVIAVFSTLWAVYYVVRPKLDIHVTVQAPETLTLKDPVIQNVAPKSDGMDFGAGAVEHRLMITAKDAVWMKIDVDGSALATGSEFNSGAQIGFDISTKNVYTVRAGKPNALKIELDGKEIHPENKYHGGGNLAEYVLDGKELLAGNK